MQGAEKQKPARKKFFPLRKAFCVVLCSSFDVKIPFGSDKTVATVASMLISLAAAMTSSSPSSSTSSEVLKGGSQQLLPAFVPTKRTLIDLKRTSGNALDC